MTDEPPRDERLIPAACFVLRTPALPFEHFNNLADAAAREVLQHDPGIAAAIRAASPSLAEQMARACDANRGNAAPRAWFRYVARMTTRCTPFGLLAAVSTGTVGAETRLRLESSDLAWSDARLDATFATHLIDALRSDATDGPRLPLCVNPTAVKTRTTLRLSAPRSGSDSLDHEFRSIARTDALDRALQVVSESAGITGAALTRRIADAEDVELEEAAAFVQTLSDAGVLLPLVGFSPVGDPTAALARQIEAALGREHWASKLLARIEACTAASRSRPAHEVIEASRAAAAGTPLADERAVVAITLVKPARALSLDPRVAAEIARGAAQLVQLALPRDDSRLQRFAQAFRARFESEAVPLLVALDPDLGVGAALIGPPQPSTLANIPWVGGAAAPSGAAPSRRDAYLLARFADALTAGKREIDLTQSDLDELTRGARAPLPRSAAVSCSVLALDDEAVRRGDYRVWLRYVTYDAAKILGRFAWTDPRLAETLRGIAADAEADANTLVAEIVHLGHRHAFGNAISRPRFYQAEIAVIARSDPPAPVQVALHDLRVRLGANDRIELIHAPTGRRVAPRLSNAHDFDGPFSLHIYRFLALLTHQAQPRGAFFSWGPLLASVKFRPRVTWSRFILSCATWRIEPGTFRLPPRSSDADRAELGARIRRELDLPRYVGVSYGASDEVLFLDLDQAWSRTELAAACVHGSAQAVLVDEVPDVPDALPVTSPEGRHRHELILPLFSAPIAGPSTVMPRAAPRASGTIARHVPGGRWGYWKVYGSEEVLEQLLATRVRPLVNRALASGAVDRWFFVRYADPAPHVRLRLRAARGRGSPLTLSNKMTAALRPFLDEGSIWDVTLATYHPECARYGGARGLDLCEQIFHADSDAVIAALSDLRTDDWRRMEFAAHAVHRLLDDFGVPADLRAKLLMTWGDHMRVHLSAPTEARHALGRKFVEKRRLFIAAASGDHGDVSPKLRRLLQARSRAVRGSIAALQSRERRGALDTSLVSIAASVVHMHANRVFDCRANAHEVVLYDLLGRAYRSIHARATAS